MENEQLRVKFTEVTNRMVDRIREDSKCLAIFLMGSTSHDSIWEWSDLELLLIYEDDYKGQKQYQLLENDVHVCMTIMKSGDFKKYLNRSNVSDFWFCALSKSEALYCKDTSIMDLFEDIFYIGDRDRATEMLLGFSQAVYYLNKAEKSFRIKGNSDHAVYFLFQLAEGIAWIEVARHRLFPEREIIAQARKLNPDLFHKIYDHLLYDAITDVSVEKTIKDCYDYLVENTLEVYKPVLSYLNNHTTLEEFSLETRPHGFGINYQWLYRMALVERYVERISINNRDNNFYQIGYKKANKR